MLLRSRLQLKRLLGHKEIVDNFRSRTWNMHADRCFHRQADAASFCIYTRPFISDGKLERIRLALIRRRCACRTASEPKTRVLHCRFGNLIRVRQLINATRRGMDQARPGQAGQRGAKRVGRRGSATVAGPTRLTRNLPERMSNPEERDGIGLDEHHALQVQCTQQLSGLHLTSDALCQSASQPAALLMYMSFQR